MDPYADVVCGCEHRKDTHKRKAFVFVNEELIELIMLDHDEHSDQGMKASFEDARHDEIQSDMLEIET